MIGLAKKKLDFAFRCGVLFSLGMRCGCQTLSKDSNDENIKFRTIENGNTIAIKDGKVVGGAGSCVGPDKLPSFSSFVSSDERKGQGFTKNVRQYAELHLKPVVEALRYPKGMPSDCERIIMGNQQIRELASHMNDDKAEILPYVAEVYREGSYRSAKDEKNSEVKQVVYTTKIINTKKSKYFVELVSKELKDNSRKGEYIQYGISKADKMVGDSKRVCRYALTEIRFRKI